MAVGGDPIESIIRFHSALRELTGRRGIRNDVRESLIKSIST
jgi:hypothetical protein